MSKATIGSEEAPWVVDPSAGVADVLLGKVVEGSKIARLFIASGLELLKGNMVEFSFHLLLLDIRRAKICT